MAIEAFAPAKVNLALHVTGLRDDGYHLLDSLVVFANVGDGLSVEAAGDLTLDVTGPFAEGVPIDGRNLVLKAAEHLRRLRGVTTGARILLDKHLPHGAGIGGGSSDAAAAIRALAALWDVAPLTTGEALPLGADVPVCQHAPRPALMRGIGEIVESAPALPVGWLVLVSPGVVVPTGPMFARYDRLYPEPSAPLEQIPPGFSGRGIFLGWMSGQRNDLTKVAGEIVPEIPTILEAFRADEACAASQMSGSGSTCWGLYFDEGVAHASAERMSQAHPDWWVRAAAILK